MTPSPDPSATIATGGTFAASPGARPFYEKAVLGTLAGMSRGHLRIELPDGTARSFGAPEAAHPPLPLGIPPAALIQVRRDAFFKKCLLHGDIGFAESHIDGDWETPDLTAVVAWFIHNIDNAPTLSGSKRARSFALHLLRAADRLGHLLRRNTPENARRNISSHYDLSNDFFELFLDSSMMYSAAKWTTPDLTLEAAQFEKNEALCRSLRLAPSDHVLEIGSGWGGWALHAARRHGCRVTTITLSQRQLDYARRRVAEAGLAGLVEVRFQDYRTLAGRFDKIVSIEMLEAVGHDYLPVFCEVVDRVLKPDGLVGLQFITCPDARYDQLRHGVDFIQKHIFPGSLLLSLNRVNTLLSARGGFVMHGIADLGHDYARTLRCWREAFRARLPEVRALGFDDRFIRKWNYYLSYCEAAFALRNITVVQTLHTRPNNLSL
ncbi:MAG TPA: cyclopropane-fatty-acyl-phospholipid synthase family protein [Rariglobus sp.]